MRPAVLVMAKAPVPGQVKTRLGADVGDGQAAELAAACLLDTLDVCRRVFADRHLALAGDLADAAQRTALVTRLRGWSVHLQHGTGLAERLVDAHAAVSRVAGAPVVQIGMDTPQVSAADLAAVAASVGHGNDAVVGPAEDGGWWVLALSDARFVGSLLRVPMSTDRTYVDTVEALSAAGARVARTTTLRDVDTAEDADLVAARAPGTHFARRWALMGERVAR